MISLPIYYTKHFKTKPSKSFLVGLNWWRNAYHHEQNEVKKHYHALIAVSVLPSPVSGPFQLEILLYYKNSASDGSNVCPMMEKYILDALQELNIVKQDNVKYHYGTIWSIGGQDTSNPRVEITLKEIHD